MNSKWKVCLGKGRPAYNGMVSVDHVQSNEAGWATTCRYLDDLEIFKNGVVSFVQSKQGLRPEIETLTMWTKVHQSGAITPIEWEFIIQSLRDMTNGLQSTSSSLVER